MKGITSAIIGNGDIRDYNKIFEKIQHYSHIIAADGGALHCLKMGIVPKLIVGDFDSISEEALEIFKDVKTLSFPKDKDETDLEIAIREALLLGSQKVALFAAAGDRLDHTFANLTILTRKPGILFLETENETIFSINKETPLKLDGVLAKTFSLLPFGREVSGVTTKGLRWELNDNRLNENFFSISNVCVEDEVFVSIKEGELFCFLSR